MQISISTQGIAKLIYFIYTVIVFIQSLYGARQSKRKVLFAMIVETKYGKIRGFGNKSVSGRKYFSFLGIPYAKPPIDELRFLVSTITRNRFASF